ncbi:hypothetical protein [Rhodophyticola sp.]|jgi:hypothetical protein|uniref:hypothetical protein n=1 Tax=Rhodophyticola sp. TaxID=2680032 RepID=UPI003D284648
MTQRHPTLATFTVTIPANGERQIDRVGDAIKCLSASHDFKLGLDGSPLSDFSQGIGFRTAAAGFRSVRIVNPINSELTVQLSFARGDITDDRAAFSGALNVTEARPSVFATPAPVACPSGAATQILPADANRKEALVTNLGAGRVFLQGAVGAAGVGQPIEPLATIILENTAALFVRNDTGASVTINLATGAFTP